MTDVKREWFDTDYYSVLGVGQSASQEEITKAYRALARKLHPDANPGDAAAEEKFKEVSSAYDVLGDEDRRRQYDQVRRMGPVGGMGGGFGGGAGPGGFGGGFEGVGDLSDLLGSVLGGGLFGNAGGQRQAPGRRGADQEARLSLSFEESVRGVTTEVMVGGRGQARKIKVRVPAGVEAGQKIRLKGRGAPGSGGAPDGDLFVIIAVESHELFDRDGPHLTLELPLTFAEAALGADVSVPTWSGDRKTLRIPPGTQPGRKFRIRGEGVRTDKLTGDLLVSVSIAVPTSLSDAQRAALEAFGDASSDSPRPHLDH